ncbi:DinB family protein [Virgibacillus siamensis]|uniref:DinB family protein n=1 Tax=Virgibacillus siamensis TaxID=480071 RepID=UPI0009877D8A|nr:DinB family protein [Virgibacillus siamensis]
MEFKIEPREGYTPQIGQLVRMMDYVRMTTYHAVKGLTTEQLDYVHAKDANSIGALLMHMAAVEFGFQIETFDEREPTDEEIREWGAAFDLGDKGRREITGKPLDYYINKLEKVRNRTLHEFRNRDDAWLYIERKWADYASNNYFIWFHTFEDEINHRGQIRIQRKMLPNF